MSGDYRAAWLRAEQTLKNGVWRRGVCDWAYRVEVEGFGSISGAGFSSRDEAKQARDAAREDAERKVAGPDAPADSQEGKA